MHKIIGVILLVIGVFLLIQGHDLAQSVGAHVTRFMGMHSSKASYYYLAGALCCAVGLVEFFRSEK